MTDLGARVFEFSTDELPEQDRIAFWREHYGHVMLRVDIAPAPGQLFIAHNRTLALPGLQLMEGSSTPARISRGGQYLDDGNDDIVFAINRTGSATVESAGRAQNLQDHEAVVLSCSEAATFDRTSAGKSFTLPPTDNSSDYSGYASRRIPPGVRARGRFRGVLGGQNLIRAN